MQAVQPFLKLKVKFNDNPALIKVACGHREQIVSIPSHPLFPIVDKITLKDCKQNEHCLRLLSKGKIELPYSESKEVIKRCKQNFKVDVRIDLHQFALEVITPSDFKETENKNQIIHKILDQLDYHIVLKIFKNAFESLGLKLHHRVTRKFKSYIDHTQRDPNEKKILENIYRMYQEATDHEENIIKSSQISSDAPVPIAVKPEEEKEQKPIRTKRKGNFQKRNSKQKYGGRSNQKNWNSKSKNKQIDERIVLGIVGDTDDGWRARMRPSRVPNTGVTNKNAQKQQKVGAIKKQEQKENQANNSPLKRLFTYKVDGEAFNFGKLGKEFTILINKKIWMIYKNGNLRIFIGDDGYSRETTIDPIDNGFIAEGVTINLAGMSNLEDGGDTFGNPSPSMFTGGDSQFFKIEDLSVFVPN